VGGVPAADPSRRDGHRRPVPTVGVRVDCRRSPSRYSSRRTRRCPPGRGG
jgi:hypothetical protein